MKHNRFLNLLADKGVFRKGKFIGRSGRELEYYCNLKKVYGDPELFKGLVKLYSSKIPKGITCLCVLGFGGYPLGALVSYETKIPILYLRDSKKAHGTKSEWEGYLPNRKDKILVIDDIYTTGRSLKDTEVKLKNMNLKPSKALVFLAWTKPNESYKVEVIINNKDLHKVSYETN